MSDLFFAPIQHYPAVPGHAKNSETSRVAARCVWRPTERQALIVIALSQFPDGLTDHELSAKTKLPPAVIQPRRSDLTALGKIVDSGARRETPYGKQATVWKLAD